MVEMIKKEPPNSHNVLYGMYKTALGETKADINDSYSNDLIHFVDECLKADPDTRPTCEMLLQHRWIENSCTKEEMTDFLNNIF